MGFLARRMFLVGAVFAALALLMAPLAGADDDDDDGGGGGDRAFCAPAGTPDPGQCSYRVGAIQLQFDFDASSGPLGENPTGTLRWQTEDGSAFYEADITCLQVTGNRAAFGGPVTASHNPLAEWIAFTVLDNTPVAPDLISGGVVYVGGSPPANAPNCGDVSGSPANQVTGDIVVQDNIAGGGDDDEDDEDDDDDDDDEDDDEEEEDDDD